MTHKQYPGPVCTKLDRILELEEQAKAKRQDLFDVQKHLDEQIGELGTDEVERRERLEAEYGRCVRDIKRWARAIKRLDIDIRDTIKGARQGKLYDEDVQLKIENYLNAPEGEDDDDGEDTQGRLEQGRKSKRATKGGAADEVPTGVNQHLTAAIAELNLDARVEKALTAANFRTIADLVVHIDSPEGLPEIEGIGGVGRAAIEKAVKAFRKAQRKADMQAEKEAEAALA